VRPTVNGQLYTIVIEPRITLLDAWREELGLTGTKKAFSVLAPIITVPVF
jgi:xanthine dehydrogenase YagT iron-sulfur-binding subunit